MPGYVGEGPARLCSQIFDATVARREMFGQLKAMRVTERLPDLRELAKTCCFGPRLRICSRRVVARPLPVQRVMEPLQAWLALPHVHIAQPSNTHFARLRAELERLGTAGNLTTDAHLAVLAMERGYVLYSTDTDFARFSGLRWVNPCKEARGV